MASVGRYELREELGRGGVGVVWRAHDPRLGRDIAIKLLVKATPKLRQRIAREGRTLARLDHPGIVRILDSGETPEGAPWVALELVHGGSLQARLDATGPLPIAEAVAMTAGVADALAYAHGLGVVHRDVKPANILLGADGAPRLGDFGLVKELRSQEGLTVSIRGQAMGTPGYFSPEQALGEPDALGPAADVYALGATLHALLTGAPPQETAHTMAEAVAAAHRSVEPPSLLRRDVDLELDALCLDMLAVAPDDRPTALEVLQRLQAWQARSRAVARRHPRGPGPATAMAVGGALVVACLSFVLAWRARSTVADAQARQAAATAAEGAALARARDAETARLLAAGEAEARVRDALARASAAEAAALEAQDQLRRAEARWGRTASATAAEEEPPSPVSARGGRRAALLSRAVDLQLLALVEPCAVAARAPILSALRFAAMGRPWHEVEPWARTAGDLAPGDLPTTLLRARLALGRDAFDVAEQALTRAASLGGDAAEVDVLSGVRRWFAGQGNAAVKLWDAAAARRASGPWGQVGARLASAARGEPLPEQPPGLDPLVDAAAGLGQLFQLSASTANPAAMAEVQGVIDRLGAVDAHLLDLLHLRRVETARSALTRDAALSDYADHLRLTGPSSRLAFFQAVFSRRQHPHWEPFAVALLDEVMATTGDRGDVPYYRGLASLLRDEGAEAVLAAWRLALERDPYLQLEEEYVAEARRRYGDTPALQAVLALRRKR